jgi:hypothetical protein
MVLSMVNMRSMRVTRRFNLALRIGRFHSMNAPLSLSTFADPRTALQPPLRWREISYNYSLFFWP